MDGPSVWDGEFLSVLHEYVSKYEHMNYLLQQETLGKTQDMLACVPASGDPRRGAVKWSLGLSGWVTGPRKLSLEDTPTASVLPHPFYSLHSFIAHFFLFLFSAHNLCFFCLFITIIVYYTAVHI